MVCALVMFMSIMATFITKGVSYIVNSVNHGAVLEVDSRYQRDRDKISIAVFATVLRVICMFYFSI